ncbi:MAG TPA: dTDP-4-dehydrorhamnose 3,5-epimerase [Bacteroidales bacterium]|nr:dTDP-4-dehydrorhamnose 3,5-epimerase [Bacteroidales bacterium]HPR10757.1 dTDP-4-dehydrorhamnose 3,5-epimerase [Bacteroidales bacterium]
MEIIKTGFSGLVVIKPDLFTDHRGYFFESFSTVTYKNSGISFDPVQDNESKSARGVVRGLHYQLRPYDQAKLIRVVEGKIYDVALDLRKDSPTYGKWYGIELDSGAKTQLFIPRGFAHGFSVLSETAIVLYKVDNVYNRGAERGILLNDPALGIDWKLGGLETLVSNKDLMNPLFRNAENNF